MTTYVHSNSKEQLTAWVWVNAAVTVQEVGKGENMWWLINNTPSFTSATLKIKHADTSLWLPEAKVNYMPGNFYNAVYIVWSSLSCVSYFVKAKLWLYIQTQKGNLPPEYEWTQQSQYRKWEKGENMWWLIDNTPSFTSAALIIMNADTSLWLPEAKLNYMPGNFYNAV